MSETWFSFGEERTNSTNQASSFELCFKQVSELQPWHPRGIRKPSRSRRRACPRQLSQALKGASRPMPRDAQGRQLPRLLVSAAQNVGLPSDLMIKTTIGRKNVTQIWNSWMRSLKAVQFPVLQLEKTMSQWPETGSWTQKKWTGLHSHLATLRPRCVTPFPLPVYFICHLTRHWEKQRNYLSRSPN